MFPNLHGNFHSDKYFRFVPKSFFSSEQKGFKVEGNSNKKINSNSDPPKCMQLECGPKISTFPTFSLIIFISVAMYCSFLRQFTLFVIFSGSYLSIINLSWGLRQKSIVRSKKRENDNSRQDWSMRALQNRTFSPHQCFGGIINLCRLYFVY